MGLKDLSKLCEAETANPGIKIDASHMENLKF